MKKSFLYILLLATVFLLGSTKVNAQSYIEEYLSQGPLVDYSVERDGVRVWGNKSAEFNLYRSAPVGGGDIQFRFGTKNMVFVDVTNVQVVSYDDKIIKNVEIKPYDFSEEIKEYNDFIEWYQTATIDEINDKFGNDKTIEEKPTWWEFRDYDSEPTWWEAYGLKTEPTNAVEVLVYAKDFGNSSITLSADGKDNITINWRMTIDDYGWFAKKQPNKSKLVSEILNNLDKYKNMIETYYEYSDDGSKGTSYNLYYYIDENEDLSEMINALKGKDITIRFTSGGDTYYYLNGKDITGTVGTGFTYHYNISMETSINKDKIDKLMKYENAIFIDFKYHGSLPAPFKLNVDMNDYIFNQYSDMYMEQFSCRKYNTETNWEEYSACRDKAYDKAEEMTKEYLNNTEFTLLYYNQDTNEMEIVKEQLKANDNGIFELDFDHFSSYVLVANNDYQLRTITEEDKKGNNAQTGTLNVALYSILTIGSIGGIGYLLKKRKES